MAERPAAMGSRGKGDNALAGTHCDDARTLLNRLVGEAETLGDRQIDDGWMNTGDEAGLPDEDERDVDVGNDGPDVATPLTDEQRPADPNAFKRATDRACRRRQTTAAGLDHPVAGALRSLQGRPSRDHRRGGMAEACPSGARDIFPR